MVQNPGGENPPSRLDELADSTQSGAVDANDAVLDIKVQEQLGKVFRAYCADLIHQPVPEKFVVLLAKLEAKQREKK